MRTVANASCDHGICRTSILGLDEQRTVRWVDRRGRIEIAPDRRTEKLSSALEGTALGTLYLKEVRSVQLSEEVAYAILAACSMGGLVCAWITLLR